MDLFGLKEVLWCGECEKGKCGGFLGWLVATQKKSNVVVLAGIV